MTLEIVADNQEVATQLTTFPSHVPENTGVTTILTGGGSCHCELISVDCLSSVDCLPDDDASQATIAMGVVTRRILKQKTEFEGWVDPHPHSPIGKSIQYNAIEAWQSWTRERVLPSGHEHGEAMFVNSTKYPYCVKKGLLGKACFFRSLSDDEDLDPMEARAVSAVTMPKDTRAKIRKDIVVYRRMSRRKVTDLPALGHLLTFAHILRIHFNRQPPLREAYRNAVRTYAGKGKTSAASTSTRRPLRVSLHIRRADSCGAEGYEMAASPLDSPAQPTSTRKCYNTYVYIDALQRVEGMVGEDRPIEVYLSTDHTDSVLHQIQQDHPELYERMTWKVLDYERGIFSYGENVVIEDEEHKNHDMLGESAVTDLWLLSNGEVFIGHLGSRFGKVGWLLATARYNRFVPFFSVDGHSYCCEIDEACEEALPYIRNMEDCMTFHHDGVDMDMNEDYWEVGSKIRKAFVEQQGKK